MRLVYAMQFRVAPLTGVGDVDLPNRLKADVVVWIGEWYRQRQGLNISLPTTTQIVTPLPLHTIDVAYSVPSVSGAGHYAVTWRYPAEPDDRLLWESRCEWATICGDTEFSFLLRLASREFLVAPPAFEIRRPRIVRTIVQKYRCHSGGHEVSLLPCRGGGNKGVGSLCFMQSPESQRDIFRRISQEAGGRTGAGSAANMTAVLCWRGRCLA